MQSSRLIVLAALVSLTACTSALPTAVEPSIMPSPSGAWTVTLKQSGGFVGVLLTVQVSSDGQMLAIDQRSERRVSGSLTLESTSRLKQLISEATIADATQPPSACSDCFIYDLEVVSSGRTLRVHADDTSIGASGAEALINFLVQLRDNALAVPR